MTSESELTETEDYAVTVCPPVHGLPKTGQTVEYRAGDDGTYQAGWDEGDRFINNGDGTLTDQATGLMWPEDWSGLGGNGAGALAWAAGIDWALALDFAGHSDWRLPNVRELGSLLSYGFLVIPLDPVFLNPRADYYWSSTTHFLQSDWVWKIGFYWGEIGWDDKGIAFYVVAVRTA